ncbi:MAG: glycosyltransferase [Ectothiorhodospiraceae bacterium]|jgi:glycosyltransferase involved in cell wall biosynthesis|nr:glycosyltransferase [Ectothiorhodospiraceae bacterium]
MKILHVITGLEQGGAEGVLYRLVAATPHHEHVVVSLGDEGHFGSRLRTAGVALHTLDMSRRRFGVIRGLWRLCGLIRAERPDLVQTWLYHADLIGGVAARLCGVRAVIWNVRNHALEVGMIRRSTRWVARACARLSRTVPRQTVFCSERAMAVHSAFGYCSNRMRLISNGYDLRRFAPDPLLRAQVRASLDVADDVVLIGMVARFDPQKDHATLLRALRLSSSDLRCVLVGEGMVSSNAALGASMAGLEDRILLLGPRDDVPAIMNALDLHVLSSAGEAFPNVVAEAMACGTPCVVTDVGDAAWIVGDTGWVVPPRDADALAQAIDGAVAALAAPDIEERRRRCRERILQRFDMDRMVAAYERLWDQAVKDVRYP